VGFGATHVERAKALVRHEFGVLVGLAASPTLATLRRWLAALAACVDAGRLQARLAANYLEHLVHREGVTSLFLNYGGGSRIIQK